MNTKNGLLESVLLYFNSSQIEQEIQDLVQYSECTSLNVGFKKTGEVERTPKKHWPKQ